MEELHFIQDETDRPYEDWEECPIPREVLEREAEKIAEEIMEREKQR